MDYAGIGSTGDNEAKFKNYYNNHEDNYLRDDLLGNNLKRAKYELGGFKTSDKIDPMLNAQGEAMTTSDEMLNQMLAGYQKEGTSDVASPLLASMLAEANMGAGKSIRGGGSVDNDALIKGYQKGASGDIYNKANNVNNMTNMYANRAMGLNNEKMTEWNRLMEHLMNLTTAEGV
jgi:hypothetical protein